jgi:predicted site-specific integrase-resolvase
MRRKLPAGVLPRNLTMRQTAEFWGVSYTTFRRLVRDGIVPPPMSVPGLGRMLFDREQQERAMDALRKRVRHVPHSRPLYTA